MKPDGRRRGKWDEPLLVALGAARHGMSLSEAVAAVHGPIGSIFPALKALVQSGKVRKDGRTYLVANRATKEAP